MRNQVGNAALAQLHTLNLAQLVFGLLGGDAVDGEAALGVVDETEMLARLLDGDDVHESGGEVDIGADAVVDLDETLHDNGLDFAAVEGVLQTIANEDNEGHAIPKLVRTGRRTGSVDTAEFVEEPMRRRRKAFHVLLSDCGILISMDSGHWGMEYLTVHGPS
jgi:hypothetical protein